MKIIQINQSCSGGGGFVQSLRLHRAFRKLGHDAHLLVLADATDEPGVIQLIRPNLMARAAWRGLDLYNSRHVRKYTEKPPYGMMFFDSGLWVPKVLKRLKPDVVLLNFFNCLMTPQQIHEISTPLFWVMHDFSPFTGGCHLAYQCTGFQNGCGSCPAIGSSDKNDVTRYGFEQRKQIWNAGITGIAVGSAQALAAKESKACKGSRIETISNGVPLNIFSPSLRAGARAKLKFDDSKLYIMVGTSANTSPLKGGGFAESAVDRLRTVYGDKIEFVSVGSPPLNFSRASVRYMNFIREEKKLADVYAACDLVLFPSLIEMFPLTVLEAMACGTPVVSFKNGGAEEIISHGVDGFLAEVGNLDDLLSKIEVFINMNPSEKETLRGAARVKTELKFDILDCARAYQKLFYKALENDHV
jgi:glycosyltransferase involved in cell wall biosynthesis